MSNTKKLPPPKPHTFVITTQVFPNFDRACSAAFKYAVSHYDIDDCDRSTSVDFDRSTDTVMVKFKEYRSSGNEHVYKFECYIERAKEL